MSQSKAVPGSLFRMVDSSMEQQRRIPRQSMRILPVLEDLAAVLTDEEIIHVAAFRKAESNRSPGDSTLPPELWKALVSRGQFCTSSRNGPCYISR
jgi:hypothetical protein